MGVIRKGARVHVMTRHAVRVQHTGEEKRGEHGFFLFLSVPGAILRSKPFAAQSWETPMPQWGVVSIWRLEPWASAGRNQYLQSPCREERAQICCCQATP